MCISIRGRGQLPDQLFSEISWKISIVSLKIKNPSSKTQFYEISNDLESFNILLFNLLILRVSREMNTVNKNGTN